ncbi:MBL fold metallo-hydrolase [Papillibacter cinnamivorans]|uniref:Glyoxylase, beta-lactamase superfamily II n=1 Tax=Papillibacter cinnamivorans DSM 12816 TaxID=1122930 RepID=A0A1W2A1T4_9FIRM|nr:MBL fold metallo-hydrolase [Papillibacter cinnamivorans]SMC54600.1 Glyoxylase, beta-lactamase superfamily II [Papillibacter cinnamivorans DSM 12816]
MLIQSLQVGEIGTNCYLLMDEATHEAAVIDPGDEAPRILRMAKDAGATVKYILLTHGHFDHTLGVEGVQKATGATVYIHRGDAVPKGSSFMRGYPAGPETVFYDEGTKLPLGNLTIEVMHTPGHSRGSCVLRCGDVLFTGDTLFRDSCGRTDLPGGSYGEILRSLKRLAQLEGDYKVYPGHEGFSDLDYERRNNYYMHEALRTPGI